MNGPTVVAIGGHSLLNPKLPPTVANQFATTQAAMVPIADLITAGHHMVLTHGNGPQVGFMQLRSEMANQELPEVPLDSLVADSQGAMGYMIETALRTQLRKRGHEEPVVTVVTEVEVDPDDQAFTNPDKPIGRFYPAEEADALSEKHGWPMMVDPKRGARRVVASPQPRRIVPLPTIKQLSDLGTTVICCGGGGIPVTPGPDGTSVGREAVIDKDRVSMLLAVELGAPHFVITTGIDKVYTDFYGDNPVAHDTMTASDAVRYLAAGEFGTGSMAPKIEAAIDYLAAINGTVTICLPEDLVDALEGRAGTQIRRDS